MKKIDLGQAIQIVANLGVIAGIVFLAVELRQNNSLLEAEASRGLFENRASYFGGIRNSPELAEFLVKVAAGQDLSEADELRLVAHHHASLINWEWEYGEYLAGRLSLVQLPVQAWRAAARGESPVATSSFVSSWPILKPLYGEEFVRFIETEIIPNE